MRLKSYFDHPEPIFNDLKILNLTKLNDYLTSYFMFQYFHRQNLLKLFIDFFLTNQQTHNHNTRNSSLIHKKSTRTNYKKHTLAIKSVDVWNNLPIKKKEPRSFASFKLII